jgi:hypothetical protein
VRCGDGVLDLNAELWEFERALAFHLARWRRLLHYGWRHNWMQTFWPIH